MKIFSHRGNSKKYPKNTVPSIKNALAQGFSVEIDIRVSRDGEFVVNHDSLIYNEGDEYSVNEMNLEEIKEIKWKKHDVRLLPTLEEVLKLLTKHRKKSTQFALHLKDYGRDRVEERLVEKLNKLDKKYTNIKLFERLFVFDVLLKNAERFKAIEPSLKIGVSVGEKEISDLEKHPTIYDLDDIRGTKNYDIIWADEWMGSLYDKKFISKCKSKEKKVFLISPELHSGTNPSHPKKDEYISYWRSMCSLDIDGICTDYPKKLRINWQKWDDKFSCR